MRFYTPSHKYCCGIDPHARSMQVYILGGAGNILIHRNIPAEPQAFLAMVAPCREDLAMECIFAWCWLAGLCAREGIAFVLGHALYMKAIHGLPGEERQDRRPEDRGVARRDGMLAQACVYPERMRATHDLLRRRSHLTRKRAELLAHIRNTNSQYNLPAFDKKLARSSNREGPLDRFADPCVRRSFELDVALIDVYDAKLSELEPYIVRAAREHDANTFYRLRSVPGIGEILALVILHEILSIERFEQAGHFLSYARLVKCRRESSGKHHGTDGTKIGNVRIDGRAY